MDLSNSLHYLIITIIAGIVVLIIHWIVKRITKGRGQIRCKLAYCRIEFGKERDKWGEWKRSNYEDAEFGEYCFELDFFNEKDTQIALRNPKLMFWKKNKKKHSTVLEFLDKESEAIRRINLPPRKLVTYGGGTGMISWRDDLEIIINSKNTYFVAELPNGKEIKIVLSEQPLYNFIFEDFPDLIEITK